MATSNSLQDPVCGMTLESYDIALTREHNGRTYVFCSPVCRERFDRDPERYAIAPVALAHTRVRVGGLSCGGDALRLEHRLLRLAGVARASVNPLTEVADVAFDPARLDPEAIRSAIRGEGFHAS